MIWSVETLNNVWCIILENHPDFPISFVDKLYNSIGKDKHIIFFKEAKSPLLCVNKTIASLSFFLKGPTSANLHSPTLFEM